MPFAPSAGILKPSKPAIFLCSSIVSMDKFAGVYSMDLGIFQEPPSLSAPELMALVFSRHLLVPLQGTLIETALNTALSKITAAIPAGATEYLQRLDQWFSVGLGPHKNYRQHRQTIDVLSHAIAHPYRADAVLLHRPRHSRPGAKWTPIVCVTSTAVSI